jgi:hypothetical protein
MTSARGACLARRLGWLAGALITTGLLAVPPGQAGDPSGPAARKKSAASLEKLAVAFHAFADANQGRMPPAAVYGKDGRPLYSWRVLILPYIGEKKLFEQFKLDEPWDGPHNKNLLSKMPEVFAPLGGEARKTQRTYYQVFVGPDTAFQGKNRGPLLPGSFPDGTSNTFLIVEAGEAVPWSAPRDLEYSSKKPVPKLGGLFRDGFHAAMASADIHFFKKGQLSERTLHHAIMPADGEVLGRDFSEADGPQLRFTREDVGKLPAGWTAAQTGKGEASVWKVVADDTAPSKSGYALAQTAASPRALFNLCVAEGFIHKDVEVRVAFKAVRGEIDQGGGLVWRYQDPNNYYLARMNPLENNYRVYKVVAGQRIQLGTREGLKVPAGEWHVLKVTQTGDHIQCFLDGKKELDVKDDTFQKAGWIGLWTKADAQIYFDDLNVTRK